ncbi:hypothetical protein PHAVU_005G051300 [Phaseolus vulgaris]|uniref:Uncharacterized protein n=1 Tax=Phaseolus vulgaris TaxID=3885 RepID=V7BVZ3_PHAVU|nr:hypothetical protein PHAVU_005G051300g [Phaseolus vulgaris]ESW21210.1 hypothetical protein PHAVU_005G051300g [Phaseolus vulgaris]
MKTPFCFCILVFVIFVAFGNEVQMRLCEECRLSNDFCDIRKDPCDSHCKIHYRSTNATGFCNLDKHVCSCIYCRT